MYNEKKENSSSLCNTMPVGFHIAKKNYTKIHCSLLPAQSLQPLHIPQ